MYVYDVIDAILTTLEAQSPSFIQVAVEPEHTITLSELAEQIRAFAKCRTTLMSERVGTGLVRALYATFVSYLPNEKFTYQVQQHADLRGVFVEMFKKPDSGQFSYFMAYPAIPRCAH